MALIGDIAGGLPFIGPVVNELRGVGVGDRVAQTIANTGQNLGLPELHLSELFGNYVPQAHAAGYTPPASPSPDFSNTGDPGMLPNGQSTYTQSSGSTGGSTGGGSGTTTQAPNNDAINNEINNIYNASMSHINDLLGSLNSNYGSIRNQINSDADTSRTNLSNSLKNANSQVDLSQQAGEQRKTDAITAARNLYNELVQGGQQRFGGASSAGEAYQALAGRELMRNNQQTNTDYNTFMGQIAQARNNLQTQYGSALASLEQQRQDALTQAQRDFNDQLTQINGMKDQANSDKATARLDAITNLRNQIFQINLATAQNSSAVQNYAKQLSTQLDQYEQAANANTQSALAGQQTFGQQTSTNPTTSLTMGGTNGQGVPQQYVGMINPNNKDQQQQLIGMINPFTQRDQQQPSPFA